MEILYVAVSVIFIAIIALVVALWAIARQVGILFERVAPLGALVTDSGPAVGAAAPVWKLKSIGSAGDIIVGGQFPKNTLLFFLSPTCPVCKKLLPILDSIKSSEGNWLRVVLASDGDEVLHKTFIKERHLSAYPYILSTELGMSFRVSRLPFAVLIGNDGKVLAKGLVNNREQIESLFNAKELGVPSIQTYIEQADHVV